MRHVYVLIFFAPFFALFSVLFSLDGFIEFIMLWSFKGEAAAEEILHQHEMSSSKLYYSKLRQLSVQRRSETPLKQKKEE